MMSWSPTAERNAVSGVVSLLSRSAWRDSPHGPELRRIVKSALEHEDRVLRYYGACGLSLLELDPPVALTFVRQRLIAEPEPDVAAVLTRKLGELASDLPQEVDALVAELVTDPRWAARFASEDHDTIESLTPLVDLVVHLAVAEDSATATQIAVDLFSEPIARPIAYRSVAVLRRQLALPPDRAAERARAFYIMRAASLALDDLRKATDPETSVDVYRMADAVVTQLFFASGAFGLGGDEPPTPAQEGFADEAFSVLEALTAFKEPSIVHHMVQTLGHLSPSAPSRAFLILEQAVEAGDAYTYDSLASDASISIIERYLAEFREVLATDPALLSAVRRVLSAFVRVGWPTAISLSSRLSDAFR